MARTLLLALLFSFSLTLNAQRHSKKNALSELNDHCLLIDGSLSDAEAAALPFVFNSFAEAAKHFKDGTAERPMRVLLKPWVYWIDDPDDATIKRGVDGREPFGMIIKCQGLQLIGLGERPEDVVLASQRGQTQGAVGNFTMFDFWGDNLLFRNLTMGNFCNVDLEYPLKPELGRKKKSATITQAHVAYCHGDRIIAERVRFISRLNMNPLGGAMRILFSDCHMESTDDALCSTGVYLHCTLDFYGQRPFWNTDKCGAVFLDCDFTVKHGQQEQYFCKSQNPLSIINCRYHSADKNLAPGWTAYPEDWLRCYQYNVQADGAPTTIGKTQKPQNTVDLSGKPALNAFLINADGKNFYNTFNLLRGEDDWDPLGVRKTVEEAGRRLGIDAGNIPTCLSLSPRKAELTTGRDTLTISAEFFRHAGYKMPAQKILWSIREDGGNLVKILPSDDSQSLLVIPQNTTDNTEQITILARTENGLEGATSLTIRPSILPAPAFSEKPKLILADGKATLDYALDLQGRADESLITWYRCTDKKGSCDIPVAVTRMNSPLREYKLSAADCGYFLKAAVQPKHLRSMPGEKFVVITEKAIDHKSVGQKKPQREQTLETDFSSLPTANQPRIIPGFWTLDGFKPEDTNEYEWAVDMSKDCWVYDKGFNGAVGYGLLQAQKGARLFYTPIGKNYGDMRLELKVDPTKTAGQGFGSAMAQYMDVYIKFNPETLTGYALRIQRTVNWHNAVEFSIVQYENGHVTSITKPMPAVCYRTGCTISLAVKNRKLTAHVETSSPLPQLPEPSAPSDSSDYDYPLQRAVDLDLIIDENPFGGVGIQHTGSTGESTTMLHSLKVWWE